MFTKVCMFIIFSRKYIKKEQIPKMKNKEVSQVL